MDRREALELKLIKLLDEKDLLQHKIKTIDLQIMSLMQESRKNIRLDVWAHHYSDTILVQKMDSYDTAVRRYWTAMEDCKLHKVPKNSKRYQRAKCNYRIAIVNLESVINRITWIDSKFYRKEF